MGSTCFGILDMLAQAAMTQTKHKLPIVQVNSLLLDTRDEVYDFRDKYQSVFRPYFDVVPFSKVEFYRLLCADACSLCARKLHKEVL